MEKVFKNVTSSSFRVYVGKPEGKGLPGRPGFRLEDNIKINLQEIGWTG
jgi:hypothetical protein